MQKARSWSTPSAPSEQGGEEADSKKNPMQLLFFFLKIYLFIYLLGWGRVRGQEREASRTPPTPRQRQDLSRNQEWNMEPTEAPKPPDTAWGREIQRERLSRPRDDMRSRDKLCLRSRVQPQAGSR